jgi:hypothetical protein
MQVTIALQQTAATIIQFERCCKVSATQLFGVCESNCTALQQYSIVELMLLQHVSEEALGPSTSELGYASCTALTHHC